MKQHPNFYENLGEAQMRLRNTMVMYDGKPQYVQAITDHKGDGKFRIYIDNMSTWDTGAARPQTGHIAAGDAAMGAYLDEWIKGNPNCGIQRKQMDSPLFNKFRPFPLGMCNAGTGCFYLERQPLRQREQGLIRTMIYETKIAAGSKDAARHSGLYNIDMWTKEFRDCVLGNYPSASEAFTALREPDVENTAIGFHRQFAFVRGPMDMIFLAYKDNVIGFIPGDSFSEVHLSRKYPQYKEVTQELGIFGTVSVVR